MREAIAATFAGLILGVIFGLLLTFWIGVVDERRAWHRDTIERGLAQYCPNDGEWAWKGECDELARAQIQERDDGTHED